jgi:hypothetical protein
MILDVVNKFYAQKVCLCDARKKLGQKSREWGIRRSHIGRKKVMWHTFTRGYMTH